MKPSPSHCRRGHAAADPGVVLPRIIVFGGATALLVMLGVGFARVLMAGGGGFGWVQMVMLTAFVAALPWTLLCFINAIAGFAIIKVTRDPAGFACPPLRVLATSAALPATALCLAIRNEDPERLRPRISAMLASIRATGHPDVFKLFLLSDSDRPDVIAAEERLAADLARQSPGETVYRRRAENTFYKAGNLRDFAAAHVGVYEFMVPLDADSLMSGPALVRLVRMMAANPSLGIVQTLAVGRPAESPFTRIFQFGMRQGMRTHATGLAWYQGPAGPYWGHNAILRLAPFLGATDLPELSGGPPFDGPVLSHDQVEAALMRGAGWDVRVLPEEFESWEENPPNLPVFISRDLRWCHGNLQYLRLLRSGLLTGRIAPMGRFQLVNAVAMYAGAPASMVLITAACLHAAAGYGGAGFAAYWLTIVLGFMPRLFGVADIAMSVGERARYGGFLRVAGGCLFDLIFNWLVWPGVMMSQLRFMLALAAGRRAGWDSQVRDVAGVTMTSAIRLFALHMTTGAVLIVFLFFVAPSGLAWGAPLALAWLLSGPVASLTASPILGKWMRRLGLCAVPDERDPPPILLQVPD